jgi:hypothetical protein
MAMLAFLLAPADLRAESPPGRFDPSGMKPDAIADRLGLGGGGACLHFVDETAVEFRKERWLKAIQAMYTADRAFVLGWIIGAVEPPDSAVAEASRQRECLVERMVHDAARPDSPLVLDWQKSRARKTEMEGLKTRYERSRSFRRRLVGALTESDYRSSRTQSWIWKRKFVFSGRNFNVISDAAADACALTAGHTWKPDVGEHKRCWLETLELEEREREILQASSAPGISRHHWGTDFDLFGLNPRRFRDRGRYADEYRWMTEHALEFGFFQTYASNDTSDGLRYMEERWHWSYYPVGQALLEFAATHEDAVGQALEAQWAGFEARWNRRRSSERPFFDYIRKHWREYMFNVDSAIVERRRLGAKKD